MTDYHYPMTVSYEAFSLAFGTNVVVRGLMGLPEEFGGDLLASIGRRFKRFVTHVRRDKRTSQKRTDPIVLSDAVKMAVLWECPRPCLDVGDEMFCQMIRARKGPGDTLFKILFQEQKGYLLDRAALDEAEREIEEKIKSMAEAKSQ